MKLNFTPIQIITHIASWVPMAVLIVDYFNDNLTINPIQAATQRTGDLAFVFLLLSLSVTPLITLTGLSHLTRLRRPLGLYACMYACTHFTLFAGVDFGFNLDYLLDEFLQKRYLWVGLAGLLILMTLAATSFTSVMRRMGKAWKRLHRLVYVAGILVLVHLAWVIKGDVLELSGDIWKPIAGGVILTLLFVLRISPVKIAVIAARKRLLTTG